MWRGVILLVWGLGTSVHAAAVADRIFEGKNPALSVGLTVFSLLAFFFFWSIFVLKED